MGTSAKRPNKDSNTTFAFEFDFFVRISKINLMNAASQAWHHKPSSLVSFDFNISWSSERGVHCAPGLTQTKLGENLLKLAQID